MRTSSRFPDLGFRHVAFLAAAFPLLFACGSSSSAGGGDVTAVCATICSRAHSCEQTQDLQTCQQQCQDVNGIVVPTLSSDVVSAIQGCVNQADCATILGMGTTVVANCLSVASASVAPDAEATTFCDDYGNAEMQCTSETANLAACLVAAKIYSDAALAAAAACTSKPCSDVNACVGSALPESGIGSSGTTSGSSSSGTTSSSSSSGVGGAGSSSSSSGSTPCGHGVPCTSNINCACVQATCVKGTCT